MFDPIWQNCCSVTAQSLLIVILFVTLGYLRSSLYVWSISFFIAFWFLGFSYLFLFLFALIAFSMSRKSIRRTLFSGTVFNLLKKLNILPTISETEKTALEAGSTWIEGQLFSGSPNFQTILKESYPKLSQNEQTFIDNQCETLCKLHDNLIAYKEGDLTKEVWDYLKKEKFLGLIIPKKYGGLEFSALGHSAVINKVAGRSIPLAISVMVPNSLGPAELLIHYGTQEQKDHYLPRLAAGQEIPCFGLTEPTAGSDAGSLTASAVIFKGDDQKLYLRMNWNKRWITLGSVASILGIAVKLYDPENLLGKGKELGITCVLVPSNTPGVTQGKRHNPLDVPFINSPLEGKDVVVSIDQIIGGKGGAGKGWQMLMECLAAGRSVSLPSQSAGGLKYVTRVTSAYAQVRQQFGISIGKFEGIDEALARIAASTYLLEAARVFTASAVDTGIKPAVASAIVKYNATELARKAVTDAMDIFGGAGITKGPKNLIADAYVAAPIAITVEGANILTRTMIIFGQGAIRCHPYAYKEVVALQNNDLKAFDKAFTSHVAHVITNLTRSIVLSLTRGYLAKAPKSPMAKHYRKLSWVSASFAFWADVAMGTLGGKLKFKEKLTGRFADVLSWMFLITATLRRYEADGQRKQDEKYVNYIASHGFQQIQQSFQGIFTNFNVPVLGFITKHIVSVWGRLNALSYGPSDTLGTQIAKDCMTPGTNRDHLTHGTFISKDPKEQMCQLETAFTLSYNAQQTLSKITKAIKKGTLKKGRVHQRIQEAVTAGVITEKEKNELETAQTACLEAIQVDDYPIEKFMSGKVNI